MRPAQVGRWIQDKTLNCGGGFHKWGNPMVYSGKSQSKMDDLGGTRW